MGLSSLHVFEISRIQKASFTIPIYFDLIVQVFSQRNINELEAHRAGKPICLVVGMTKHFVEKVSIFFQESTKNSQ